MTDDKWDDFSSNTVTQPKQTIKSTTVSNTTTWVQEKSSPVNTTSWTQEKPSTSNQTKNDWDSDAFFNDVLTTTTKPKLKTSRR